MSEVNRRGSARFVSQVRKVVEFLRTSDHTAGQLADLLFCTKSGVRNYLRPLRNQGLVREVGVIRFGIGPNSQLLRIDADKEKVDECLRLLAETPNPGMSTRNKDPQPRVKRAGKVHKICNEPHVVQKPAPAKAPPRHWLDRALFGDGPAPSLAVQC